MSTLWGEFGFGEWLWAQIHNAATTKPRVRVPVPPVKLPGCAAGEVSWRRWLNWQQANSITAFSVQLTREIVVALAHEGIVPIETWLRHNTHTLAVGGGHKRMSHAYGDPNGVYVESLVRIPIGSLGGYQFDGKILPSVYCRYPIFDYGGTTPANWLPGPYGFRAAVTRVNQEDPYDTLRVVSPGYCCRYRRVGGYPGRYLNHWPLDAAEEREPLTYPNEPWPNTPQGHTFPRADVPAIAEYTLAEVIRWSAYLGCRIGDTTSGWIRNRDSRSRSDGDTFVITAPVVLTVTEAEIEQRALPHTAVSTRQVPSASHEPTATYRNRSSLVTFRIFNGLAADISDLNTPGEFNLKITGRAQP